MCHSTDAGLTWTVYTGSGATHSADGHVTKPVPPSGKCSTRAFVPPPDCDGDGIPDSQDADNSGCSTPPPQLDCKGHPLPNNHNHTGECTTPPPDCDNDGIDDNVDPDIQTCQPPPPGQDCDGDGVPDDVDSDLSGCEPIELCPNGEVMPANRKCNPSVLPDFVLGIRLNNNPPPPVVLPKTVSAAPSSPAVAASVLPFTGGDLLPFVLLSLGLMGAGLPALLRKRNS